VLKPVKKLLLVSSETNNTTLEEDFDIAKIMPEKSLSVRKSQYGQISHMKTQNKNETSPTICKTSIKRPWHLVKRCSTKGCRMQHEKTWFWMHFQAFSLLVGLSRTTINNYLFLCSFNFNIKIDSLLHILQQQRTV